MHKLGKTISNAAGKAGGAVKGAFSKLRHAKRAWVMFSATLAIVAVLSGVLLNTQIGFAVQLGGMEIGSAKSAAEVNEILQNVQDRASQILGYEYSLSGVVSVTTNFGGADKDIKDVEEAILAAIPDIAKLYTITVDGVPVGASEDKEMLQGVLDSILEKYTTENTTSARFLQDVTIEYMYVPQTIAQTQEDIFSLLTPTNIASECRLTVENTTVSQYTEAIDYDYEYIDDPTKYIDDELVYESVGVKGEQLITTREVFLNDKKQSTDVVSSVTTKEPVTERVLVGTKEHPDSVSTGSYIWPTGGTITCVFGGYVGHTGLDIGGAHAQSIYAADAGTVIYSGWQGGYGYMVQIRHDSGDVTYYAHCSSLIVEAGDEVFQGQTIAYMGSTGNSTGTHLHFEIIVNGTAQNPQNYLP